MPYSTTFPQLPAAIRDIFESRLLQIKGEMGLGNYIPQSNLNTLPLKSQEPKTYIYNKDRSSGRCTNISKKRVYHGHDYSDHRQTRIIKQEYPAPSRVTKMDTTFDHVEVMPKYQKTQNGEQCIQSYLAGNTETELSAPHRVVSSDDLIKVKCEGNEELSFDKQNRMYANEYGDKYKGSSYKMKNQSSS